MPASFTIPSVFTAVDKFSAPVKKMSGATSRFAAKAETNLARGERAFRKLTSPLQKLNRLLGGFGVLIGGALIVSAFSGAIKIVKDFEQANANLSAVMADATGPELQMLSADAKRLGATTAKSATEVVGLQEAFARLGFTTPDIINMTEATIAGSIAMNAELDQTAELVGAMVRTFDGFTSLNTPQIIDQMTTATQRSALNFEKLQTSLPIVAGAANAAGVPFTKLMALLGKLSDSGIDASSSANALKRIFIEAKGKGSDFNDILASIEKNQNKLTASVDEFGVRASVSAVILSKNIRETEILEQALNDAAGSADKAAKKQLATLNGALTILESSYQGFILSLEDGTGKYAETATMIIMVASQMLSLASGSAVATDKLTEQEQRARSMAETGLFLLKGIGLLIGAMIAFKAILIVSRIALAVYNIAMGIAAALNGTLTLSVAKNTFALGAYKVVTAIVTGVQWLWNAAISAGAVAMTILTSPITLIILGIAATIALITVIIKKYNEWGAALSLVLGPLGFVINLIQSFRRNWDMIKESFSQGGILSGLKAIGVTILDAILMPLQQVFKLLSNIPGVGAFAAKAVEGIEKFREKLGVNVTTDESGKLLNADKIFKEALAERQMAKFDQSLPTPLLQNDQNNISPAISPEAARQESLKETITEQRQNTSITVKDDTGRADVETDNEFIPVNVSRTYGLLFNQ